MKSPAIVRAGHTVTVSIDRPARDFVRISHGQFRRDGSGPRVKAHTIRFESCSRRRARSTVDGRPVTFWSGFFVIKRTPACLPLTITVDGGRPRRYRLPIGSVDCGPPRVRVPRLVGLGRGEAFGRLRAAGLRPSTYAGARRYEPNRDGLARRVTLVPAGLAGPRRVTVQGLRPWVPVGSPVAFGTQPAPGRYRFVRGLFGGDIEWVRSMTARGRRLALELIGGDCDPIDHVDVAMRRRWVLLVPYVIGGRGCGRRDFVRRAELRLPESLAGRPVPSGPRTCQIRRW